MPKQLSLEGFDMAPSPPSPPTDRLFFAIIPDALTAERIARLVQGLRTERGVKGKALAQDRLHISLHHLGDHVGVPKQIVALASKAAAAVTTPAFQVAFDRATSFSGKAGNRPLVLCGSDGVAALMTLVHTLDAEMERVGFKLRKAPPFKPHLTLLYGDHQVDQSVETIAWTVREFVLVRSLIGQSRYEYLARWPLHD